METRKWGLWILTAFVVGNMVGGGVFMLPANLAQVSGPLGSTLAWSITGLGVFTIALVFGNLSVRKPELKAGPQSYAQAMFPSLKIGKVAGYSMAWGYWAANWAATASVIISFAGYLSTFFPILQSKQILFSISGSSLELGKGLTFAVCSIMLWGIQYILSQNIDRAGNMNLVATIAKIIGFTMFIVITLFIFNVSNLGDGQTFMSESGTSIPLGGQVNSAAIATLWAFIGIESAVMLSNRAKSQRDVKRATILGLIIALLIYMAITLLTMGALPQEVLKESQKPLVDALNLAIGNQGAYIMALLALISLFGSTVGWIVVSSEVPYQAAKNGLFPKFFGRTNQKGSPSKALLITNIMTQIFLFSTISGTVSEAYHFAIVVATLAYLIPYLVSTLYQLKLVITGETYEIQTGSRIKDGIITLLAFFYSTWVIKTGTADLTTFFLGIGLFVLGLILYPILMKNSPPLISEQRNNKAS
ncbi:amino acid permease [Bacillus cytotoxicus]|uniref:Amino acid permease-associated region n=1 Tax=Bacillus cytotoxicus TaxID=580165 RepID=A0AAX2CCK4_9BACI|nr:MULTISPECIES: amino acid permease [Bacillus cereus group]MDH2879993.1 amino acid permease [Bacillus cytotoxicus]QTR71677.1 amino acid permease [Bacillus cytotoxicus]QTR83433.1 amino acid permease [Bacillus cytotoxicus]QTR87169.1 amino acid permease [Bacillus cytotoxicus]SCL84715.1 Amino acid permease-associated region [Bacillus cytotoxicus]